MKLMVLKENLKNGLNIVERITGKNLTLPVLGNVLISAEKNFLNLATTDLEIGINYWILAKIEKEGKAAVPAKFLSDFISLVPDEKISLEFKNGLLLIEGENLKAQIKAFNAEEFPIIPIIKDEKYIEISNSLLLNGLSQVVDFCAATQIRPELSGVYFRIQKERIQLAATDSFRLTEKIIFYEKESFSGGCSDKPWEYSFILPQKTGREILNILSEKFLNYLQGGKVKIYFSPNQILFEFPMIDSSSKSSPGASSSRPQLRLISRLIEGEFPDYQEIIPKKYQTQVILLRDNFLNQIRTTSLFSGKINEIRIKIDPRKEKIELFSQSPDLGENKSYINGKIKGQPGETSFNYRFLVDGLSNIKTEEVIFELNGDGPAVLRPVGDTSYIYVVMPINL